MAEKYGTDAIRLSLILGTTPGQDFRLSEEKIAGYRNFINKLWNIGNFVERQSATIISPPPVRGGGKGGSRLSLADNWIIERTNWLIAEVTKDIQHYKLSEAGQALYDFVWHELADWYVEIQKIQPNTAILTETYETVLKLLHPFAPFVTEALWEKRHGKANKDILMIQAWPKAKAQKNIATKEFTKIQKLIVAIRNVRALHKVAPSEKLSLSVSGAGAKTLLQQKIVVETLARTSLTTKKISKKPDGHEAGVNFWLELPKTSELHVKKEAANLKQYIQSLERKLANQQFTKNAPVAVVEAERKKLADAKVKLQQLSV
jgi:valyl-tRNA synthetase